MHALPAPRIALERGTPLLGDLSPVQFMRRHWQRRPLLVRAALGPDVAHGAPLDRRALFALAADEDVASRLIVRGARQDDSRWTLRHGPFARRALPPLSRPGWTLLVQGVDRRVAAARALLDRFRFVPDARLDDVMVSYASDGGGVGPHLDSYDVFLLQVQGHRRWRIAPTARAADRACVPGLPLRILAQFTPRHDWLLAPGDLLYLPPGWAHEGTAVGGDCMTCSIGFRAPDAATAGREALARLLDAEAVEAAAPAYRDPAQPATATPAAIPPALAAFVREAARRLAGDTAALDRAIGTWLSEPPGDVWFDADTDTDSDTDTGRGPRADDGPHARHPPGGPPAYTGGACLDGRTRLLYDDHHLYINGVAVALPRRDAAVLRRLADERALDAAALRHCTAATRALLAEWAAAGWLRGVAEPGPPAGHRIVAGVAGR